MNYFLHNIDPFAIQFTETFGIRWYGLAYLAAFITGYFAIMWMAKKGRTLLKPEAVADFITYVAVGVLAGGRIGYCIFYSPDLLWSFDGHFPFWGVLRVNEGGMASHGGIVGVMLVCWLYARSKKISSFHTLDLTVFGGAAGFFFGRLANFINGELFGRVAPASFKYAVQFPQEMYLWTQQDFEKLKSLGPAAEALGGQTQSSWLTVVSNYATDSGARRVVNDTIESLILATQKNNIPVIEALAVVLSPRYPSQLIQAVLEGLLVFLALLWIWYKPRKPGVIAACFGIFYCGTRIIGEHYRMPDAQIGFQMWGLTRGQWLSIIMLSVGFLFLWYAQTRKAPFMGGWKR